MTASPLRRFVITPLVISATVFGVLSLPMMIFGRQPIDIKSQEESVFSGELRDIALPYLGLASLVSLAAGTASVALSGWRASSDKSAETKKKLSTLEQDLKEKEKLLENLKVSESHLTASGLAPFLDEEIKLELEELLKEETNPQVFPVVTEEVKPKPSQVVKPEVKPEPQQTNFITSEESTTVKPLIIMTSHLDHQPMKSQQGNVQTAASKFTSAQSYMGYAKKQTFTPPKEEIKLDSAAIAQLQSQLQQMQAQMKVLNETVNQQTPTRVQPEVIS
ncbi:hypothetical protein [Limnofasciculus baicalensis]|uniref:Uncharacterized protein n=1 Tax=Limnofasciculus baicalensis BBK-W-15 TaxID=2699891 RepID=A0AAE3KKD0_9CYAN|nr:hypothetical protein [Limnofasciculus baicalensis]MCP2726929.1 hypothetical protein [Limnofasciculus baicalensis BBK-W-15]